jgi:hypothetical protein
MGAVLTPEQKKTDMQMVKKFPGRIIQVEDGGIKELS